MTEYWTELVPDGPLCVICFMLLGRRACPAITQVAGDPVCADHVKLRVDSRSLREAIAIAEDDLQPGTPIPPVDPLTERELVVLHYLAGTLTGTEIAAEMYLSINTIKTHLRTIYRKLGADSRRDAVRRARQLQLL